ncbi:MAG: FAD-dependent oxidoreductase [Bythopirellula sp.]
MGSPFLLAHGLGEPVPDAKTEVEFPKAGEYRVWVRTRDWVAPWNAPGAPGRFQLLIDGVPLNTTFGTEGGRWHWQYGGKVMIDGAVKLALHDLTGFEGRCDAIVFSKDHHWRPPNEATELATFRRRALGLPEEPVESETFDLVVVGGGMAGTAAAVTAARLDLSVALIQDRPVLGGNASSEVRVWPQGHVNQAPFPRVGDVVMELMPDQREDSANGQNGNVFDDDRKMQLTAAEPNITLFMEQRVNEAHADDGSIQWVVCQHVRTAVRTRIRGRMFLDSTGDGAVGFLVNADFDQTDKKHMGASNLWNIKCLCEDEEPLASELQAVCELATFPRCPWAVDLTDKPFPGRESGSKTPEVDAGNKPITLGQWFWESGFDRDPINDMERIRDQNFRAAYGAWDTIKNVEKRYPAHRLNWVAYIAGKRESRRLLGDVILTGDDLRNGKEFKDGCFPCTWGIDTHFPDKRYQQGHEGDEFIARHTHGKGYTYKGPYWVPYRCLYSRNISNLFMAGRDISVTHEALGAVRVMKTTGAMGEIVAMAASLCKKHDCTPREVYASHLDELKSLMEQGAGKPAPQSAALQAKATASSVYADYSAAKAIDGAITNDSRWVSEDTDQPKWLVLRWPHAIDIGGVHIYMGWNQSDPLENFVLQTHVNGQWVDIDSSRIVDNKQPNVAITFDRIIRTDALRLNHTDSGRARVKELVVWPTTDNVPLTGRGLSFTTSPPVAASRFAANDYMKIPTLYLNQSGFNLGKPKRFTAPTLEDGTPFAIRLADQPDSNNLFSGVIDRHIGDFSSFDPDDDSPYVVVAGNQVSVPFQITPWHLERTNYQGLIDFMVDSRHYHGTHTSPHPGNLSYSWRDDHQFAFELHSLVTQFMSNPQAYIRMKRQVSYKQPHDSKLWGALDPYPEDAPDIVKMIHWGADVIVTQELTHEHFKGQLAFFLYAWPALQNWLPEQNYQVVSDFAFRVWEDSYVDREYPYDKTSDHNLLTLRIEIGTTKGESPPGSSIQPNLLMFEVACRKGREDARKYFDAAYRQTEWMVESLDWEDPQTTKGQRMSEWVTMTGLSHFLREYPNDAPQGLRQKIEEWASVVIRRSDNMWDFRRLADQGDWTPSGDKPTMWNEPGNVAGLPAALLSATEHIEDESTRKRLEEIAYAHFDNVFGRNPTGRHFSYDAPREIEGVEHGWFSYYVGGAGQLEKVRYVLDGAPKREHYPYHPEVGNVGHTEGWVNFNTAYNAAFAYLARHETKLRVERTERAVVVTLRAPLNFDFRKPEPVVLDVVTSRGDVERVVLEETTNRSFEHVGQIAIAMGQPIPGNGTLELNSEETVESYYGFGFMKLKANDSAEDVFSGAQQAK